MDSFANIKKLLTALELGQFIVSFQHHGIGIQQLGPRKKILKAIADPNSIPKPQTPPPEQPQPQPQQPPAQTAKKAAAKPNPTAAAASAAPAPKKAATPKGAAAKAQTAPAKAAGPEKATKTADQEQAKSVKPPKSPQKAKPAEAKKTRPAKAKAATQPSASLPHYRELSYPDDNEGYFRYLEYTQAFGVVMKLCNVGTAKVYFKPSLVTIDAETQSEVDQTMNRIRKYLSENIFTFRTTTFTQQFIKMWSGFGVKELEGVMGLAPRSLWGGVFKGGNNQLEFFVSTLEQRPLITTALETMRALPALRIPISAVDPGNLSNAEVVGRELSVSIKQAGQNVEIVAFRQVPTLVSAVARISAPIATSSAQEPKKEPKAKKTSPAQAAGKQPATKEKTEAPKAMTVSYAIHCSFACRQACKAVVFAPPGVDILWNLDKPAATTLHIVGPKRKAGQIRDMIASVADHYSAHPTASTEELQAARKQYYSNRHKAASAADSQAEEHSDEDQVQSEDEEESSSESDSDSGSEEETSSEADSDDEDAQSQLSNDSSQ